MAFRTNKTPVLQEKSASGAVATFDTALAMPLASCKIALTATQSGSGTPSPSNVRPISGFSALNVTRTGVNLLPLKFYKGLEYNSAVGNTFNTEEATDGTVSGNTVSFNIGSWGRKCMLSPKLPTGVGFRLSMTVSSSASTLNYTEFYLDKDLKVTRKHNIQNSGTSRVVNAGFNLNEGECYVAIELGCSASATITFDSPQLKLESTASVYHPYNGQTATVNFGQTVYGGEYDARTGVLTCNWAKANTSTMNWNISPSGLFVSSTLVGIIKNNTSAYTPSPYIKCSAFECVDSSGITGPQGTNPSPNGVFAENTEGVVYFNLTSETTIEGFKAFMSDKQLIYELATPTTIQLPPCPIETLLGVNNVWADTGDVDLTYKDLDIAKRGNFREVFRLPS